MKPFHTSILVGLLALLYYQVYIQMTPERVDSIKKAIAYAESIIPIDIMGNHVFKKNNPKLASNSYMMYKMADKNREQIGKENATLVMLVRNLELEGALSSMRSLEDRFNKDYKYPWVFMNDVPFTDEFIEQTTLMASSKTYYELIPTEDWQAPKFLDETKIQNCIKQAAEDGVIYGGYRSYRNMCHFNSGYFFRQKKLLEFDWYFRVEPNVEYLCDFQYDPFRFLRENNMIYGFVTTIHEYENTIPTLWQTVERFMEEYPELIHPNNSLEFITTKETDLNYNVPTINSTTNYNLCHFWSNFEIANLNFWRSPEYLAYFDYLDRAGGFYYERWGDAPVHSIALNILADKNKIHHFEDLGYFHAPYLACPLSKDIISQKRCICKVQTEDELYDSPYDIQTYSCLSRWWRYGSGKKFLAEVDYT